LVFNKRNAVVFFDSLYYRNLPIKAIDHLFVLYPLCQVQTTSPQPSPGRRGKKICHFSPVLGGGEKPFAHAISEREDARIVINYAPCLKTSSLHVFFWMHIVNLSPRWVQIIFLSLGEGSPILASFGKVDIFPLPPGEDAQRASEGV